MTEQNAAPVHIAYPGEADTFCSAALTPDALMLDALENAQPGAVCPACLGQVMEYKRLTRRAHYTAYVWPSNSPRVLSETFSHIAGVWAYRLSAAQILSDMGASITRFEYTSEVPRHD